MNFLHPGLLIAGLLSVSIPIIIHLLFRQRRRPVAWAAMRFLLEAYRRKRRRLKLEHLILLLVRCLAIACLGVALGRPLLDAGGLLGATGRDVYVLIDNGVGSSLRLTNGGTALDEHKTTARAVLDELGPGDRAGLIALGAPARPIVLPPSSDLGAVWRLIENLESTDSATDLQGALGALATHLESMEDDEDPRPTVGVVLSELREGGADVTRPLTNALEGLENVRLLALPPSATGIGNVRIAGIDPLRSVVLTGAGRAAEDVSVRVRLSRTGTSVASAGTTTVRLRAADPDDLGVPTAEDARATVRWTPGQSDASVTMSVRLDRSGEEGVGASVLVGSIDRDALEADNLLRVPVRVTDALEVGVVGTRRFAGGTSVAERTAADWLRPALAPTESTPVRVTDLEPGALDAPTLAGLDALFVAQPDLVPEESWPALRDFADAGGMVVVTPPAGATVHLWTDPFVRAFGLDWAFPREAVEAPEDGVFTIEPEAGDGSTGVLALLADELEPLVRPVGVFRTLPPDLGGTTGATRVLNLDDGTPWLVATRPGASEASGAGVDNRAVGRGILFYMASAPTLAWTDLPARPLMVPLVQELVRQGVGSSNADTAPVAGRPVVAPSGATSVTSVGGDSTARTIDVDSSGLVGEPITRTGVWTARDVGGKARGVIAVNADLIGSRTGVNDPETVRAWLGGAFGDSAPDDQVAWLDEDKPGVTLSTGDRGSPFSMPLLIAALALVLVETLLARWFAHAWRDPKLGEGALA